MAEMYGGTIQAQSMTKIRSPSGPIGLAAKNSLPSFKDLGCFLVSGSSRERHHHIAMRAAGITREPSPAAKNLSQNYGAQLIKSHETRVFGIGFKDGFPL